MVFTKKLLNVHVLNNMMFIFHNLLLLFLAICVMISLDLRSFCTRQLYLLYVLNKIPGIVIQIFYLDQLNIGNN